MTDREYASMQEWWDSLSDTEREQKIHRQRQWAREMVLDSYPDLSGDEVAIIAEAVRAFLHGQMMDGRQVSSTFSANSHRASSSIS